MRGKRIIGLSGLLALAALLLVVATSRRGDPRLYPSGPGEPAVEVFLVDNGFHPDLALPRAWIAREGGLSARAAARLPEGAWIEIGWGDERFYKAEGWGPARLIDGVRCLLWPNNRSVVRMEALSSSPDRIYPSSALTRLRLSQAGMRRMILRLDRSLVEARGAPVLTPPAAHDPEGVFFAGRERLNLLHMCNHWIADMLDAAGVPTTPVIDTVTAGLLLDLRLRAGARPHAKDGRTA